MSSYCHSSSCLFVTDCVLPLRMFCLWFLKLYHSIFRRGFLLYLFCLVLRPLAVPDAGLSASPCHRVSHPAGPRAVPYQTPCCPERSLILLFLAGSGDTVEGDPFRAVGKVSGLEFSPAWPGPGSLPSLAARGHGPPLTGVSRTGPVLAVPSSA